MALSQKKPREKKRRWPSGDELYEIYSELQDDIRLAGRASLDGNGDILFAKGQSLTASERRHFVRATAAMIEACCYQIRLLILSESPTRIGSNVKLALLERQVEVSSGGKIDTRDLKIPTMNYLKFTFRTFDRQFKSKICPDFGSRHFSRISELFQARNLLMHPKKKSDLTVSAEQVEDAAQVFHWFTDWLIECLNVLNSSLEKRVKKLKDKHELLKRQHAFSEPKRPSLAELMLGTSDKSE
jgi:hypothetical protein